MSALDNLLLLLVLSKTSQCILSSSEMAIFRDDSTDWEIFSDNVELLELKNNFPEEAKPSL